MTSSFALMSRPADGLCAIEIIAKNIALADSSTITHFRRWSRNMINTCQADQNEVKGGIATSMGQSRFSTRQGPKIQVRAAILDGY